MLCGMPWWRALHRQQTFAARLEVDGPGEQVQASRQVWLIRQAAQAQKPLPFRPHPPAPGLRKAEARCSSFLLCTPLDQMDIWKVPKVWSAALVAKNEKGVVHRSP